jgi:hypothetical protein
MSIIERTRQVSGMGSRSRYSFHTFASNSQVFPSHIREFAAYSVDRGRRTSPTRWLRQAFSNVHYRTSKPALRWN